MTQMTRATFLENLANEEIRQRTAPKPITIWSQDDDGEWHDHSFANEGAAAEYEIKGRKRGFATRRGA